MKFGVLLIFLLSETVAFSQSVKVFEPDKNVDTYYKGFTVKPTRLALNADLIGLAFKGQCDVGIVCSILNRIGLEGYYGFPIKQKTLEEPHFKDNTYNHHFTTSFNNEYGVNAFIKSGKLGLSKTVYAGMGLRMVNFLSTYDGKSTDNKVYSYGQDMYWFLGAMETLKSKFQINFTAGLGFRNISAQDNLDNFATLAVTKQSIISLNIKLQYAIF